MLRSTCSLLVGRSPLAHYLQRPYWIGSGRMKTFDEIDDLVADGLIGYR